MSDTLVIRVLGQPVSQGSKTPFAIRRKGATGAWEYTGRVVLVEKGNKVAPGKPTLKEWRRNVAYCADVARGAAGWPILNQPLELSLTFYLPRPKKPKWSLPAVKPDASKLVRAAEDAMTGVLYVDDSRVCSLVVWKLYATDDEPMGVKIVVNRVPLAPQAGPLLETLSTVR